MRLALRRALGGIGAAAGVLPLLPVARRLAELAAGPARLPGAELASGDVKAAIFAEAAVLVLLVPIAAFLFGRVVPDGIRKRGGYAVAFPGLALGSSFLLWRSGVSPAASVLAGLAASAAAVIFSVLGPRLLGRVHVPISGAVEESAALGRTDQAPSRARLAAGIVLLALFAAAARMFWFPHGPVDLFEHGAILAPAQVYLAGGAPYRDAYPVHGWGADGGLDGILFRLFSPTLEVLRIRYALTIGFTIAMLGLACWTLFRRPLWSLTAFVLAMSLCSFPSDRQAPAFAGLAALVHAARSGGRRAWAAAGAVCAAALFYSLDFGAFLLVAGLLTALSLAAAERNWRRASTAAAFAAGAALGSLPFLAMLAGDGALGAFFRVSFGELRLRILDLWGVPAASPAGLLQRGDLVDLAGTLVRGGSVPWLFHAAILALAASLLLFRSRGGLSTLDRGAAAATWFALVSMRGVLGRADEGHLVLYGVFAALPATWLFYRAARAAHAPWIWAPVMALVLVIRIAPQRYPPLAWALLRHPVQPSGCFVAIPRSGAATVPCAQAAELAALREAIDRELAPGQTFFDYGSEPGLHFLLERRPPIRYCCVPFYEGPEFEGEVIAALERERPPVAILASGTALDAFDDVASRARTPLVAAYLDRNYEPIGRIGTRLLGRRRSAR